TRPTRSWPYVSTGTRSIATSAFQSRPTKLFSPPARSGSTSTRRSETPTPTYPHHSHLERAEGRGPDQGARLRRRRPRIREDPQPVRAAQRGDPQGESAQADGVRSLGADRRSGERHREPV